jgi:hypothetical protein
MKFLLLALLPLSVSAWDKEDTTYQSIFYTVHTMDYMQTLDISRHCGVYYEINPILGSCPSSEAITAYFIGTGVLHYFVAKSLPKPLRNHFQALSVTTGVYVTSSNARIGLKVRF